MTAVVKSQLSAPVPQGAVAKNGSVSPAHSHGTNDTKPKALKPKRPNYAQLHSRPLPVDVHPLPAFLPHNPLSIVRIAIALLSHSLWPPISHTDVHNAYFSTETQSIHVTDPKSIRALWEHGFWGAGSLSRSEPAWLAQEKRKRGIEASQTSEEFTRKRREERRQFKLERAKVQRETIEQQLRDEGKLDSTTSTEKLITHESNRNLNSINGLGDVSTDSPNGKSGNTGPLEPVTKHLSLLETDVKLEDAADEILDQEHLQLTPEEAFFPDIFIGLLTNI